MAYQVCRTASPKFSTGLEQVVDRAIVTRLAEKLKTTCPQLVNSFVTTSEALPGYIPLQLINIVLYRLHKAWLETTLTTTTAYHCLPVCVASGLWEPLQLQNH